MHEITTTDRMLDQLKNNNLLNKAAASLAMSKNAVGTNGLMSARERFICECIASMHDRLVRDKDIGAHCRPPELRLDHDPETYLFTPDQAVDETVRVWISYGMDPTALRLMDRPLTVVAAEVVSSYKDLVLRRQVLDIRDEHDQESLAVTDARHRYVDGEGKPFSEFRWSRPESRAILAKIPVTDPVNDETLDRAVREYVEERNAGRAR